jgi:hypothetical protein
MKEYIEAREREAIKEKRKREKAKPRNVKVPITFFQKSLAPQAFFIQIIFPIPHFSIMASTTRHSKLAKTPVNPHHTSRALKRATFHALQRRLFHHDTEAPRATAKQRGTARRANILLHIRPAGRHRDNKIVKHGSQEVFQVFGSPSG